MKKESPYRLTQNQKNEIAQNLLDILQADSTITQDTKTFICKWILTDYLGKTKAFYDVWDIVLRNYLPVKRPILFRSCQRKIVKNRIASFTGSLNCVMRFSKHKGYLIICNSKDQLKHEAKFNKKGNYKKTFYPLVNVLKKAQKSDGWGFSANFLEEFIGEDEHIMHTNFENNCVLKWAEIS
ncbi:hypothetical protein ACNQGB_04115 [Flavobacterium sp. XS1P32]|uniref:hypothetical protein n=1 Tax=Flavobacterium sp. XS1P32 TaxID=3401726 RepID=UPI003AAFE637